MLRRLLSGAGLSLGVFHVWLFGRQALTGELASPETLVKWLAAAALAAALVVLRRQGVPLLRGRKAVAIWVLAALLHAPAIGERLATLYTPAIPETAIVLTTLVESIVPLAGVLLLLLIARAHAVTPVVHARAARVIVPSAARAARASIAFAPRPPPSV